MAEGSRSVTVVCRLPPLPPPPPRLLAPAAPVWRRAAAAARRARPWLPGRCQSKTPLSHRAGKTISSRISTGCFVRSAQAFSSSAFKGSFYGSVSGGQEFMTHFLLPPHFAGALLSQHTATTPFSRGCTCCRLGAVEGFSSPLSLSLSSRAPGESCSRSRSSTSGGLWLARSECQ